jgi:Protein required for attachment to host cells
MKPVWILVANSSRAIIYTAEKSRSKLEERAVLEQPAARMHERELTSDLPGRAFDRAAPGRHAMTQQVEPKQEEALRFAKRLGNVLDEACQRGEVRKLYVLASPAFLGLLRRHYSPAVSAVLAREIDKDLTQATADEVRKSLPEYL